MKRIIKTNIAMLMLLLLVTGVGGKLRVSAAEPVNPPQQVTVKRNGARAVRLKWSKVENADGYIIYKYNKTTKRYQKLKIIKNRKTLFYIDRIGYRKSAKYRISSFKNIGTRRKVSKKSYYIKARTYYQGDKKVNVGNVTMKKVGEKLTANMMETLAYYETLQLSSKVKASNYSKASGKTVMSKRIRWYSTDSSVARVDKNGLVTAQAKAGTCYVYTRAHNGIQSNKIKITVTNYAKPDREHLNLWDAKQNPNRFGAVVYMFMEKYNLTTDIAAYFNLNRPSENEEFVCKMTDGKIVMEPENYVTGEIRQKIYDFIKNSPYNLQLTVTSNRIEVLELFGSGEYISEGMNLTYLYDKTKSNPREYDEKYKLAPLWVYGFFAGY